ncbi:GDSL esterase/lipase 7-like [Rhododendron vialii]|uniref:GDSL esterase/lipase 7-like n=1 Tax=Rhododendron vialii TaxID=182163 RepID=UPI00265F4D17|nr:GDSL esterase/lipase 7-like [Rhododendron vialii]
MNVKQTNQVRVKFKLVLYVFLLERFVSVIIKLNVIGRAIYYLVYFKAKMTRTLPVSVRFCYLLLHLYLMSFTKKCLPEEFPNLYVFGDSIFDNGVKRSHVSGMRTGYSPYGIECHWYDKFRFTNGRTIPEMIAVSLKLKLPTSFDESAFYPEHGVTYASASAGILPDTGSIFGTNYCFEEQIGFFKETLEKNLRPKYQSAEKLSKYLSDSIFFINIGSSDYIHNYLQPHDYSSSRQYNGEDFAQLLTTKLGDHLKELYNLGAR